MSLSSNLAAASDRTSCYHCGERVPTGVELGVLIGGEVRPMCCPGCRAVAELISTTGLDSFYRQRTAYSQRPPERETTALEQYLVYDDPALAASFSDTASDGQMTARLLLGGISCAACTWLIEQTMARLPGVSLALVNLQQSRLDIRFDPAQIPLSRIFSRLDALGYQVRPFQASARRAQMWAESRQELRRLGVAALGMMQVGMFSMALYAGDIQGIEIQYQGLLRWVSLLVASFVVLFSSRVFFTTAWRHLRQGALVMDLPVALAIGLAWLASVWATITNSGQSAANNFDYIIEWKLGPGNTWQVYSSSNPSVPLSLAPGANQIINGNQPTWDQPWCTDKPDWIPGWRISVDTKGAVAESNENNNGAEKMFEPSLMIRQEPPKAIQKEIQPAPVQKRSPMQMR